MISVSSKSGTNQLHGSVYDFLRRYQWDANNIAANAAGRPIFVRDPVTGQNLGGHKLDQYGLFLGGPVLIPKVYNGKDKTFWGFTYENYRESTPSPGLTSVPTVAQRSGDFSATGVTIYDPYTTRPNPNFNPAQPQGPSNPPYIRDQFPGNIIPKSRINTVGFNIANAYPAPNVGTGQFNNYLSSPNLSLDKFRNYYGRVDHNFSERERIFARYGYNNRNQFDQGVAVFPGPGFDAQDPLVRENHNAVLDSVTVLNPSAILDLRLALTRYTEAAYRRHVYGFDAAQLGFPASFSAARPDPIPPRITLEQYGTDFGTRNQRYNVSNILSFGPNLSLIHGKHSVRFGLDFRDIRLNTASGSFVWGGGQFSFTRDMTTRFPGIQQNDSGSAVAALTLGTPSSGVIQSTPALAYRWPYYALYAQDDIKLTTRLTVNLGLRWDVEGSPTERYNRMNRGWDYTATDPTLAAAAKSANPADCPACATLTGGLLFAGTGGQPREAFATEHDHFQPRVGAAFRLTQKTVLRGGFGTFFLPEATLGGVAGFAVDTPFVATLGGGANQYIPVNTLSNPFPNGLFQPAGSLLGPATFAGSNVIFVNPNRQIPHVNQYSVGVQHQLPWNVRLDASYVGSRTYDLNTNDNQLGGPRNINVNTVEQLALARQNPNYFNQAVPNPFAGLLSGTSLNGATVPRSQLLKPYPQFNNVTYAAESVGKLWYDALQVSAEKRYTQGMVLVLAYTWAKNLERVSFLNNQDTTPVKELTSNDRPHRLVLSGVWELPFGRGKALAHDVGRPVNWIIAGWEYNFIGTIQSGTPIDLPGNVDLIGNPTVSNQNFGLWFNNCVAAVNGTANCQNPAWQLRAPNTLRTMPFRIGSLRNPIRPTWDMSLAKKVYLTERFNFQARLEAFNVFNTPIRGGPVNDPTRSDFGLVPLGQSNIPRQVQLGFKLNF